MTVPMTVPYDCPQFSASAIRGGRRLKDRGDDNARAAPIDCPAESDFLIIDPRFDCRSDGTCAYNMQADIKWSAIDDNTIMAWSNPFS